MKMVAPTISLQPQCPSLTVLQQFNSGQLDDAAIAHIGAHLETCDSCEQTLSGLHDDLDGLQDQLRKSRDVEVLIEDEQCEAVRDFAMNLTYRVSRDITRRHSKVDEIPEKIGRYECEKLLGSGGYGRVYLAKDPLLQREVAIKVIHSFRVAVPGDRDRFLSEGRTLAKLNHPNLVSVYDVGIDENDVCFTVMEYVQGQTLRDRLQNTPMGVQQCLEITRQIINALSEVHQHGVVHRDLKPANILLNLNSDVLLTDFGLAMDANRFDSQLDLGGTPAYMAPEQFLRDEEEIDERTDIWALGVTMYEMLTGRRPFNAGTPESVFKEISEKDPPRPSRFNSHVSSNLDQIVLRCLNKQPSKRFQNLQEIEAHLKESSRVQKIRRAITVAAITIGLALGIVGLVTIQNHRKEAARQFQARILDSDSRYVAEIFGGSGDYQKQVIKAIDVGLPDLTQKQKLNIAICRYLTGENRHSIFQFVANSSYAQIDAIRNVLFTANRQGSDALQATADRYWQKFADKSASSDEKLRCACLLAKIDPKNEKWNLVDDEVTTVLLKVEDQHANWGNLLEPVAAQLAPALSRKVDESDPFARSKALRTFIGMNRNHLRHMPWVLGRMSKDEFDQYVIQAHKQSTKNDNAVENLLNGLLQFKTAFQLNWDAIPDGKRERAQYEFDDERTRSEAYSVLLACRFRGQAEPLWTRLARTPNPGLRSYLIAYCSEDFVAVDQLIRKLESNPNPATTAALLKILVNYLSGPAHPQGIATTIAKIYQQDDDPEVHSSAQRLLRELKKTDFQVIHSKLKSTRDPNKLDSWHVGPLDLTFVSLPAATFRMGQMDGIYRKTPHDRIIVRPFAVATTEITKAMYQEIMTPEQPRSSDSQAARGISQDDAMKFCLRLSQRLEMPASEWCYQEDEDGIRPVADFLIRTGYRLPTDGEWEYACRGNTSTLRHYGFSDSILPHFEWTYTNATRLANTMEVLTMPVGTRHCNHYGLFDCLGNAGEWSQIRSSKILDVPPPTYTDQIRFEADSPSLYCGGSVNTSYTACVSTAKVFAAWNDDWNVRPIGFRICRTLR